MFDSLSDRLGATLDGLKGKGRLSEDDINKAMREIRLALLEADVNFGVVKDFVDRVRERAMGSEVMDSLTPGQQVVKIVHEELTSLMGEAGTKLSFSNRPGHDYDIVRKKPAGVKGMQYRMEIMSTGKAKCFSLCSRPSLWKSGHSFV